MIEDNPTNLQLMVYLLTASGHATLEAHEGAEGLEKAGREHPDLILLDIHMPQMDGYEVARRLRSDPRCSTIPVVAVTALAMVGDREKILTSGFNGYISKPIDPDLFLSQIKDYLGSRSGESPTAPARGPRPPAQAEPPSRQKRGVVLFVDNCPTNIDLVRSVLEPSGFDVVAALSAEEGLNLARRVRPDLILSDVHMPHEDGYSFMRAVQSETELKRIPFVFLSASLWSTREQAQALALGAAKFLSRPIEPQALLEEIEGCLRKRAL